MAIWRTGTNLRIRQAHARDLSLSCGRGIGSWIVKPVLLSALMRRLNEMRWTMIQLSMRLNKGLVEGGFLQACCCVVEEEDEIV